MAWVRHEIVILTMEMHQTSVEAYRAGQAANGRKHGQNDTTGDRLAIMVDRPILIGDPNENSMNTYFYPNQLQFLSWRSDFTQTLMHNGHFLKWLFISNGSSYDKYK